MSIDKDGGREVEDCVPTTLKDPQPHSTEEDKDPERTMQGRRRRKLIHIMLGVVVVSILNITKY